MDKGQEGDLEGRGDERPGTSRRGGRPRDASRDAEIVAAAIELVAAHGYDRLTIDAVAARARAGKATIYRRWRSKAELVIDAVIALKPPSAAPDTGTLAGDLRGLCSTSPDLTESLAARVMAGLCPAIVDDAELRSAFIERFVAPRHALMLELFERAARRGELAPGADPALLSTLLPALVIHRVVTTGDLPAPPFFDRLIDEVIVPLATGSRGTGAGAQGPPGDRSLGVSRRPARAPRGSAAALRRRRSL